ncbi:MAG: NUDIX domain-containing protein [Gammaproteobacteria bacterium]|nr:NUDIX domain-containing protein [Gammaproteobacteria bacterium]
MKKQFELLSKHVGFQGFFRVDVVELRHTLFAGGWSNTLERELFQRGECVAAVLYDPIRDNLVLIEQFRVGAIEQEQYPWLLEIVAGAIEPGENPEAVVRRESLEESGCEVLDLELAHVFFTTPGGSSERIHMYCARVDSRDAGGLFGLKSEDEDIRAFVVSFAEAMDMLEQGKITSGIPLVGLYWLARNRTRLRKQWVQLPDGEYDSQQSDSGC